MMRRCDYFSSWVKKFTTTNQDPNFPKKRGARPEPSLSKAASTRKQLRTRSVTTAFAQWDSLGETGEEADFQE